MPRNKPSSLRAQRSNPERIARGSGLSFGQLRLATSPAAPRNDEGASGRGVTAEGTPEHVVKEGWSFTGAYLKPLINSASAKAGLPEGGGRATMPLSPIRMLSQMIG